VDRSPSGNVLRLPTLAVPVTLAVVGQDTAAAELFVADVPRTDHGQLVDDLAATLDDETHFVPARIAAAVQLVAKHAVSWVSLPFENDAITLHEQQHHVTVQLLVGGTLAGTLLHDDPHDRPRVIDHLNSAGKFVRLWTASEHYLINKSQILQVTEE
jgi:hypothetical protein